MGASRPPHACSAHRPPPAQRPIAFGQYQRGQDCGDSPSRAGLRCIAAPALGEHLFHLHADSRNRAQVVDGGFSADYASASDFIGKFTCGKFVARDGLDTTDDSEFCNVRFDRQVERASLQATRSSAADRLWSRLDRS